MTSENWTEERERLLGLIHDYETGKVLPLDEVDDGLIKRATTEQRLGVIKQRLAALNDRLNNKDSG